MYGRKVKLRFLFIVIILITLILTVFLILKSLEENVVYFQSPSEINSTLELNKKKIKKKNPSGRDDDNLPTNCQRNSA